MSIATLFIESTVNRFRNEYLPRIRKSLDTLPEADLWWYAHDDTTSVGNLLYHLEGNVRQWMLSGIGGQDDQRNRASEFARREGDGKDELFSRLAATVEAACQVIEALDEAGLQKTYAIQGQSPNGVEAIYHVLEHFGYHLGQITWIAKMRAGAGHGLAYYDAAKLNTLKNG
ncbi:MAG: DUF1572 domain-containing protein [Blastocatellia bacterium]|nr:DUF1572 domain-containing protein [Blastocatellia bacterium]